MGAAPLLSHLAVRTDWSRLPPNHPNVHVLNLILRRVFPFEIAHITMAYSLRNPPCAFFRDFDVHAATAVACGHSWCDLEFTGRCCVCMDKRKRMWQSKEYVDGYGPVLAERHFYGSYCAGCKATYDTESTIRGIEALGTLIRQCDKNNNVSGKRLQRGPVDAEAAPPVTTAVTGTAPATAATTLDRTALTRAGFV